MTFKLTQQFGLKFNMVYFSRNELVITAKAKQLVDCFSQLLEDDDDEAQSNIPKNNEGDYFDNLYPK